MTESSIDWVPHRQQLAKEPACSGHKICKLIAYASSEKSAEIINTSCVQLYAAGLFAFCRHSVRLPWCGLAAFAAVNATNSNVRTCPTRRQSLAEPHSLYVCVRVWGFVCVYGQLKIHYSRLK